MALVTTSQFGDLFASQLAILKEVIHMRHERWPSSIPTYFSMESTSESFVNYTGVSPLSVFAEKPEGVNAQRDAFKQLFDKKLTPVAYAMALEHSRETLDDDKFGVFDRLNGALGDAAGQSKDILAADMAEEGDDGTDSVYLSADGENIFDASHPIDAGASTDSNLLTAADLSVSSVQTAMTTLESTLDDRGNLQMIIGNHLVVPRNLQFTAAQLVKSIDDSSTADRAVSSFVDKQWKYSVWQYLTDQNKWYMTSDFPRVTEGWIWLDRQPLDIGTEVNELAQTALVVAFMRFIYGVIDWRGWVLNPDT